MLCTSGVPSTISESTGSAQLQSRSPGFTMFEAEQKTRGNWQQWESNPEKARRVIAGREADCQDSSMLKTDRKN